MSPAEDLTPKDENRPPINAVLASNLGHFMRERGLTQASLGKRAGLAQRTIGNYLKPELRQTESKSGKPPSAKLTEVEQIADALGVEVWELLRPISPAQREFYRHIEESFKKLREMAQPSEQRQSLPSADPSRRVAATR